VILTVSDDNPLLVSLLSLNDGGNDAIIAFLNTLTKMQDDLLAKRNGYENPLELLFENDPPKVDLNALLEDCDFQRALLTSWDERDFENFVLSHATFRDAFHSRASLTFDIPRIERQVCEYFSTYIITHEEYLNRYCSLLVANLCLVMLSVNCEEFFNPKLRILDKKMMSLRMKLKNFNKWT
jgi:hypothetical protein